MIHDDITAARDVADDDQQPNEYREAGLFFLRLIESAVEHALAAKNPRIGLAQLRFALGLATDSMSNIAAKLKVSPQCISKGAREFIEQNNLPVPLCMEDEASSKAHRAARIRQLRD
jgi:hypothetical protein